MALSRLGRLEGFAYQSPPPSYCRRAPVRRMARGCHDADAVTSIAPRSAARPRTAARLLIGAARDAVSEVARSALTSELRRDIAHGQASRPERARAFAQHGFVR